MTALHPLEDKTRARGVLALQYPINETCAHPLCDQPTESRHHIFARSKIGNSSWFVALEGSKLFAADGSIMATKEAIPHVIGLCGHGTAGHHGDAEEHRSWIKLNPEGVFVLYERVPTPKEELDRWEEETGQNRGDYPLDTWKEIGPLDPQPGSRIKHRRPKKKDHRNGSAEKRSRSRYTFAIPKAVQEDGADLLDEGIEAIEEKLGYDPPRSAYYTLMDAINFAQLNMDSTDVG